MASIVMLVSGCGGNTESEPLLRGGTQTANRAGNEANPESQMDTAMDPQESVETDAEQQSVDTANAVDEDPVSDIVVAVPQRQPDFPGKPNEPTASEPAASEPEPREVQPLQGGSVIGRSCPSRCPDAECYVSGTGINPICSKVCDNNADCGRGALCQASGGTQRWCLRTCEADSQCRSLSPSTDNPLYCAASTDPYDPYYGGSYFSVGPALTPVSRFCVQESEP